LFRSVHKLALASVGIALISAVVPSAASAEGLLRITPEGWSPSAWDAANLPTDPVPINSDGFRLTYQGGGTKTVLDPVLLILGIPTTLPAPTAPSLTQTGSGDPADYTAPFDPNVTATLGGAMPYAGTSFQPTTWDSDGIINTPFNSSVGNLSVYQFLGLTLPNSGGSDSENYTNWSSTGFTSWNLFVYELTFTPDFQRGEWVEFASTLPVGSYVVGYGVDSSGANAQATPFTFAGNVTTTVPEPSTLSLLIPGVLLLARKRQWLGAVRG
jgi:hypothetical protein